VQGTSDEGFFPQRRKQNPPKDVQFAARRLKTRKLHFGVKIAWTVPGGMFQYLSHSSQFLEVIYPLHC
jgi:hypothetical protein